MCPLKLPVLCSLNCHYLLSFLRFSPRFLFLCLEVGKAIREQVDVRFCPLPRILSLQHQVCRSPRRHRAS